MRFKDILTVIFGALVFYLVLNSLFPQRKDGKIISPIGQGIMTIQSFIPGLQTDSLKTVVEKTLEGTNGTYGLVIKNLQTDESYMLNENRTFQPASLYKLWVMGTVFEAIKQGTISEDTVLSKNVSDLNKLFDIDDEVAERTEGTITATVSDALYKMITVSDNYSALLLASYVRNSTISTFIVSVGLKNSGLGEPPKTTPSDIALFYERLFQGNVINGEYSKKMIDLLGHQQINDRIPKYLPQNIIIAHKTGEIEGFKHDVGIIFAKDPILIVAMSESSDPAGAAERIAKLSKNVYDYFEKGK